MEGRTSFAFAVSLIVWIRFSPRGSGDGPREVHMSAVSSAALIACTAAFVVGLLLALPGWLRHALAERLNLRRGRVDGLLAALNLALIPMMLLSGTLIDTIGVRAVLIVGALICAVAVFGLTVK